MMTQEDKDYILSKLHQRKATYLVFSRVSRGQTFGSVPPTKLEGLIRALPQGEGIDLSLDGQWLPLTLGQMRELVEKDAIRVDVSPTVMFEILLW
ncbi:MAG: hypothetical protein LUC33_00625 [Prevotellaceae bacterium]|nr:hypothetical protein [Prevotellaceae bacterium]